MIGFSKPQNSKKIDARISKATKVENLHNKTMGQLFYAEKGTGAWMNGPRMNDERIRVSARSRVSDSLYATGIPFAASVADLPSTSQQLKRLMPISAGVRRLGSAALDLAYVAAGRYDGYFQKKLNLWDIAAGLLLVKEAGGITNEINPNNLKNIKIIASNSNINQEFQKKVLNF